MIEFIKSLPKPVLISSCVVIYILIGMLVSFIAGLFDDGNEDFIAIGALWIFVLPLAALLGVFWIFVAPYKAGRKHSRNLTDEEAEIYESWLDSEAEDTGINIMHSKEEDK